MAASRHRDGMERCSLVQRIQGYDRDVPCHTHEVLSVSCQRLTERAGGFLLVTGTRGGGLATLIAFLLACSAALSAAGGASRTGLRGRGGSPVKDKGNDDHKDDDEHTKKQHSIT